MAPITILAVLAGCSLVGSFSLIGCPHTLAVRATRGRRLRPTPLRALVMRQLYPVGAPLTTGNLAVSSVHTLYYELHGKADGVPALFLHGGPGAGCARRHAGFFDPTHYRVVLFDQRGCGKSTPRGSLEGNDTPSLVADCEALRRCFAASLARPTALPLRVASVRVQAPRHRNVGPRPRRVVGRHPRPGVRSQAPHLISFHSPSVSAVRRQQEAGGGKRAWR